MRRLALVLVLLSGCSRPPEVREALDVDGQAISDAKCHDGSLDLVASYLNSPFNEREPWGEYTCEAGPEVLYCIEDNGGLMHCRKPAPLPINSSGAEGQVCVIDRDCLGTLRCVGQECR